MEQEGICFSAVTPRATTPFLHSFGLFPVTVARARAVNPLELGRHRPAQMISERTKSSQDAVPAVLITTRLARRRCKK